MLSSLVSLCRRGKVESTPYHFNICVSHRNLKSMKSKNERSTVAVCLKRTTHLSARRQPCGQYRKPPPQKQRRQTQSTKCLQLRAVAPPSTVNQLAVHIRFRASENSDLPPNRDHKHSFELILQFRHFRVVRHRTRKPLSLRFRQSSEDSRAKPLWNALAANQRSISFVAGFRCNAHIFK